MRILCFLTVLLFLLLLLVLDTSVPDPVQLRPYLVPRLPIPRQVHVQFDQQSSNQSWAGTLWGSNKATSRLAWRSFYERDQLVPPHDARNDHRLGATYLPSLKPFLLISQ